MPFFAEREGEIVKPSQVEDCADLVCRQCGGPMGVWDSFENKHGHFVSRHFKHTGDSGGCSGGESDPHIRMKQIALHKLQWELENKLGVELAILDDEYKIGEGQSGYYTADVFCEFESPRYPQGKGIIVEVQFKHEQKDIEAVSEYYLENGYSVYWVWPEQFDRQDVDLRAGDVRTVWPHAVPEPKDWGDEEDLPEAETYLIDLRAQIRAMESQASAKRIPATPPPEWHDREALRIFRSVDWDELFSPPEDYTDIWCYAKVPAELPPEWHEREARRFWRHRPWDDRFWLETIEADQLPGTPTPSVKAPIPFGEWIRTGPIDGHYRQILEAYHRYGMEGTKPPQLRASEREISESLEPIERRIYNIIRYNTGGPQPETASLDTIRLIASHAGIGPGYVDAALRNLINDGHVKTTVPREFQLT